MTRPRFCAYHGDTLVWEDGGDDKPTLRGRWYCPSCQAELMQLLEESE